MILLLLISYFLFLFPIVLTLVNLVRTIKMSFPNHIKTERKAPQKQNMFLNFFKRLYSEKATDLQIMIFGFIFTYFYMNWAGRISYQDPVVNPDYSTFHAIFARQHAFTIIVLTLIAISGYLILSVQMERLTPGSTIICISTILLGSLLSVLTLIHLMGNLEEVMFFLILFPLNYLLCAIRLIRKVIAFQLQEMSDNQTDSLKGFSGWCQRRLTNSLNWIVIGFVFMVPVLGVLICFLLLFGQRPDAVIRAFTETADWGLSQKISPPPVYRDDHYLCTVALNGHHHIVKPTRCGIRHGRKIIVNRQLCIANAFEQLIEEKAPRLHKHIRQFYDRYGYPLSKHIRSKSQADIVYLLMKPLEWIFLTCLYMFDKKPENRIALQYTGVRSL